MLEPALVAAFLLLAAFTFSFAGFGFSLIAVPLLALLYPTAEAVVFQYAYALCVVIYHALRFRGQIVWPLFWPLALGALIFMPLGAYALHVLPDQLLKRSLAVFLLFAVLVNRTSWGQRAAEAFRASYAWGVFWGGLSGLFQGVYTTGGPPAVIYVRATVPDPAAAKGILGVYFTLLYLIMGGIFAVGGMFSQPLLIKALWYSPWVVAGTILGALAFRRVSLRGYQVAIDLLLIATTAMLWIRS